MLGFNGGLMGIRRDQKRTTPGLWFPNERTIIEGTDRHWDNVSLLLHMSGANNSTTFTDSSNNRNSNTASVFGNAKISTAQSKFDGSSAVFDGTTDYVTFPLSPLYNLFDGDFTIEFWVYLAGTTNNQTIAQLSFDGTNRATIAVVSGLIVLYTETTATLGGLRISGTAPSASTWHHVACTRNGSTSRLFLNGSSLGTASSAPYPTGNLNVSIGANDRIAGDTCVDGNIDELRITKGVARYTANFTPPTAPFPDA